MISACLPLLFKALDADPLNDEAGYIAETQLAAGGHLQHIQKLQDRRAALVQDPEQKVKLLRDFALIWQVRLNNADMASYFYRQALEYAYSIGGATLKDEAGQRLAPRRVLPAQEDRRAHQQTDGSSSSAPAASR
jgi:hypothetical protein